mgnify:CR=1 FL=1
MRRLCSFDRTYEELKHITRYVPYFPTVLCFDRTYEELKLPFAPFVELRGRRFDRTYEELKQSFGHFVLK